MEKIGALNTFIGLLILGALIISGIANYKKQKKEKNPSPGVILLYLFLYFG